MFLWKYEPGYSSKVFFGLLKATEVIVQPYQRRFVALANIGCTISDHAGLCSTNSLQETMFDVKNFPDIPFNPSIDTGNPQLIRSPMVRRRLWALTLLPLSACWLGRTPKDGTRIEWVQDWYEIYIYWLVVSNVYYFHLFSIIHGIIFSIIYGMSSFPLTFIFFNMVKTTNR